MDNSTVNSTPASSDLPLHHRVAKGGFWIFLIRIAQQLLATGRVLILAVFLTPADFGLLGIALLTMGALNTFTQVGFRSALVQRKGDVSEYLDSAWTIGLIRAGVLFLLLVLAAPFIIILFDGAARFKPDQFMEVDKLVAKLQTAQEPACIYITKSLAEPTREKLKQSSFSAAADEHLRQNLAEDFNQIIQTHRLDQEEAFQAILTSERAQSLSGQYLLRQDYARANRLLLEETFDLEIKKVLIDRKVATLVLQVMALCFLLIALSNVGTIYFQKDLKFHKQFIWQIVGTIFDFILSVLIAWKYRTVWALVAGRLCREVVQFFLSYILHSHRPRFYLDREKSRKLWQFGKWILASGALGFILNKGADIFVAQMISVIALGYFSMAQKLSRDIIYEITQVVYQATFPAYAKIQDNILRLRQAFLQALRLTSSISFPLMGLIIFLAPDFVRIFMKEKWLPIIPLIQLFALWGIIQALFAAAGSLYPAIGRPRIVSHMQIIKLGCLAVLVYPLTRRWGLSGAALALICGSLALQPVALYLLHKILSCPYKQMLQAIVWPLLATLIMGAVMGILKYNLFTEIAFASFALLALVGLASYCGVMYFFDRLLGYGIINIIQEQLYGVLRKYHTPA